MLPLTFIVLQFHRDSQDIYAAISDEDSDDEESGTSHNDPPAVNNDPAAVRKYIEEHLHEMIQPLTKGPPVSEFCGFKNVGMVTKSSLRIPFDGIRNCLSFRGT